MVVNARRNLANKEKTPSNHLRVIFLLSNYKIEDNKALLVWVYDILNERKVNLFGYTYYSLNLDCKELLVNLILNQMMRVCQHKSLEWPGSLKEKDKHFTFMYFRTE